MRKITNTKSRFIEDTINETNSFITSPRDPIYQWFFNPEQNQSSSNHKETMKKISKGTEKSLLQKKEILEPKKGKPISAIIKTIQVLRELHYWLSAMSKDYAKMLGVKQPNPQSLL